MAGVPETTLAVIVRLIAELLPSKLGLSRGSERTNLTQWVTTIDDDTAMNCAEAFAGHFTDGETSAFALPWCLTRGPRVHRVVAEEWAGGERVRQIGTVPFSVPEIGGLSGGFADFFTAKGNVVWPLEGGGNCLVVQQIGENGKSRRQYLGPVSPICALIRIQVIGTGVDLGGGLLIEAAGGELGLGVIPGVPGWLVGLPGSDYTQEEPTAQMINWGSQWVFGLDEAYGPNGNAVVIAGGEVSNVARCRTSSVFGRITTRLQRGVWEQD